MSTILVTGAATGFGNVTARTLAHAGHTVYASMRNTRSRNAPRVQEIRAYAAEHGVDLRTVELNVQSQESCDAAIAAILSEQGALDVVVHNAGHLVVGPTEAFTPEEIARVIDVNALGAQRVNRAVLPHMREVRAGLLLWVGSTTSQVPPPFLGPYVAAKAAMDGLAAVTAYEVAPFGIESAMVVPGAFTSGTEHFTNAGHPADGETAAGYEPIAGLLDQIQQRLEALTPADANVQAVADEIARVVDLPVGERPMRTVIDPIDDGAGAVIDVMVERRTEFMGRLGLEQMLHPANSSTSGFSRSALQAIDTWVGGMSLTGTATMPGCSGIPAAADAGRKLIARPAATTSSFSSRHVTCGPGRAVRPSGRGSKLWNASHAALAP